MRASLCHWFVRSFSNFPAASVRRLQGTYYTRKVLGYPTFGLAIAKCNDGTDGHHIIQDGLTREDCIKQACLLSVNSASTLLTTTSSALLDICQEYKSSLSRILNLLEQLQSTEGENPQLWDSVVEARANLNKAKAALLELTSYMESVEKVVNSTTEAAFLAGAEYMCTVLCERLYSAQKEIQTHIEDLRKLEEDYIKIQKEIVSSKENKENKESKEKPEVKKSSFSLKNLLSPH